MIVFKKRTFDEAKNNCQKRREKGVEENSDEQKRSEKTTAKPFDECEERSLETLL